MQDLFGVRGLMALPEEDCSDVHVCGCADIRLRQDKGMRLIMYFESEKLMRIEVEQEHAVYQ